jgi:hypothetical protein
VVRRSQFRTLLNKAHIRIFAFWDKTNNKETLVLTTHGIVKKTGKVSDNDIEKAEKTRILYFEQKNK